MKDDTGKSLHLVSRNVKATAEIANNYSESEKEQVLLVIQLIFIRLLKTILIAFFKRASQKLNALARVALYMNMQKIIVIMKSFVMSQFGYCPLI